MSSLSTIVANHIYLMHFFHILKLIMIWQLSLFTYHMVSAVGQAAILIMIVSFVSTYFILFYFSPVFSSSIPWSLHSDFIYSSFTFSVGWTLDALILMLLNGSWIVLFLLTIFPTWTTDSLYITLALQLANSRM